VEAADCFTSSFLETVKLKVSDFHRYKSVSSGAHEKIEVPIASDTFLFYKLLFLCASLIFFFMTHLCMDIDDYLKMLSLSRQF